MPGASGKLPGSDISLILKDKDKFLIAVELII